MNPSNTTVPTLGKTVQDYNELSLFLGLLFTVIFTIVYI